MSSPSNETFGPPITLILTDHNAIIVKIPAKIAGIISFVCSQPVTSPANIPPTSANNNVTNGLTPLVIRIALIHPPSANVPSQDKSAISKILNVI